MLHVGWPTLTQKTVRACRKLRSTVPLNCPHNGEIIKVVGCKGMGQDRSSSAVAFTLFKQLQAHHHPFTPTQSRASEQPPLSLSPYPKIQEHKTKVKMMLRLVREARYFIWFSSLHFSPCLNGLLLWHMRFYFLLLYAHMHVYMCAFFWLDLLDLAFLTLVVVHIWHAHQKELVLGCGIMICRMLTSSFLRF